MQEENPSLQFVIPKEGSNLFIDSMCIPKGAPHQNEAAEFINFMCRSDIAALNADEICYGTPVKETLGLIDQDLAESEIAYPGDDVLKKCETYINLPDSIKTLYDDLWLEIVSK
ncbi:Spermidine-binding periplasmic protein SpuE [bioreactor metagenome]|uniref:Spermidine-binding periplasmic protein SpuE n=1 Tax=bioreactor metagenome TaxID=1076179 RepID=A0A645IM88_9ZZZZ